MKMKKRSSSLIVLLVLVLGCMMVIARCGKKENGTIGTTYQHEGLEFSVNGIYVADVLDGFEGTNDEYLMPVDENNSNVGGRYSLFEYKVNYGLTSSDSDNMLVMVSYNVKNVAKKDVRVRPEAELDYDNGYEYESIKMTYRPTEDGFWVDLDGGLVLKQLKENSYEFREVVELPKIALDDEKDLILYVQHQPFNLRDYIN